MASAAKTIVATGVSSGLGFEAIKQLLEQAQPYKVILGARNIQRTQEAFDAVTYDRSANHLTVLPLELNNLRTVQTFAKDVLEKLGQEKLDYILFNAGMSGPAGEAGEKGPHGSKWCEPLIVNHTSQHYLMHLLKDKAVASKTRIGFVSSGAIRNVPDVSVLDKDVRAGSGADTRTIYCETKFIALLGAHWWRRELLGSCNVVAVSPGMIPNTGLFRQAAATAQLDPKHPDAKSVSEGGTNILQSLFRDDIPEDPERIFITSWGEWWEKSVYESSLDKDLQNKWCPTKEELEKEEGVTA